MATVAFLGLGKMGLAMASNVQKAGHPITAWNRSIEKATTLAAAGARVASSPQEAVAAADIVITSLADDASVEAVVTHADGILAGMRKGGVHVGTSTISPRLAGQLSHLHAEHGSHYVSGPVLGRLPAAEAAQLITFVAGEPSAIETARPVIESYASQILPVGAQAGQASSAKLIANLLGAAGMDLIGQALALAERSNVPQPLVQHMLLNFFGAEATHDYVNKIAERDFDNVGFTTSGGLKDIELMITAGQDVQLDLSAARALRDKLKAAISRGWEAKDWSCFTDIDRLR